MKFETPKMDINVFSENVLTEASGIAESATVNYVKQQLQSVKNVEANKILTFTFD